MPTLKVTSGPGAGQSLVVDRELVVGRENADLTIADAELSRRHAVVRPAGDGIEVEDLGSVNGTFVDGQRIEAAAKVAAASTLRMGTTSMTVELESSSADVTAPRDVPAPDVTAPRDIPPPDVTAPRDVVQPDVTAPRNVPAPDVPEPEVTAPRDIPPPDVTAPRDVPAPDVTAPRKVVRPEAPAPEPDVEEASPLARLEVTAGPAKGAAIAVGDEPFLIGRAASPEGRLGDDSELSRRHAQLYGHGGRLTVEDLDSMNGTFVNDRPIGAPTALEPGDRVRLGSSALRVLSAPAQEPADERLAVPAVTAQRPRVPAGDLPPAAAPRRALRVVAGTAPGTRIPLGPEPFIIGREAGGEGSLDADPELSRRHAMVSDVEGKVVVEDLGSTNGTFVNGERIGAPTPIGVDDAIRVGTTTLQLIEVTPGTPSRAAGAALSAVSRVRAAETSLLGKLARVTSHSPRKLLAGTAAFVAIAAVFGVPVAGILPSQPRPDPDVESSVASDRLEEASGRRAGVGVLALVRGGEDVSSRGTRAKVDRVLARIREEEEVAQVFDFYSSGSRELVSKDRRSTYVGVVFKNEEESKLEEVAVDLRDDLERQKGVIVGGELLSGQSIGEQAGKDLGKAEGLAFPILFVASLFIFRGLVAALLPLFVGIVTIFATFLALRVLDAAVTEVSVFALNMVIALGLGLAIDYSLFIVSRYREELARQGPGPEAIRRTLQTAGRTIIFSALTVAAALASLLLFPQKFISSIGIGGAVCSLIALVVSLVALPALLSLLGPRINALSPKRWRESAERSARQERGGFWYRVSQGVMRRPLPVALASGALLLAMGLPFLRVEFNNIDAQTLPESSNVRKVDTALQTEFPSNRGRQINLAVEASPQDAAGVESYANGLKDLPGVVGVERPRRLSEAVWQVDVLSRHADTDERTLDLVREIRDRQGPFPVAAAGPAAAFIDQQASLGDHLPLALAVIAIVTVILLFSLTGSLLLPIKALVMNLLTVSAAFGILVLIFQDGRLEGLLAFDSQGGLEATQPLLLFALAFGLSTDYAVFLLTRIKEARDAGASEQECVALGLERTGRIVTAAALLFCIAVGAFATSQIIFIKQLGLGVAFAVIIDATIVRALLVPSLMALLGRRNWWSPAPLRRLHRRIAISEGGEPPSRAAARPSAT